MDIDRHTRFVVDEMSTEDEVTVTKRRHNRDIMNHISAAMKADNVRIKKLDLFLQLTTQDAQALFRDALQVNAMVENLWLVRDVMYVRPVPSICRSAITSKAG
jgi:hypothetical protein